MYYPKNFLSRQFTIGANAPGHNAFAFQRTRYQYGGATRGVSPSRWPAAAAFAAVAPFNFFTIIDNLGTSRTFELRPDIAPPTTFFGQVPSVPGRKVIAIQGLATGALVAAQVVEAITQESFIATASLSGSPQSRLGVFAVQNTAQAVDDEVILSLTAPGPGGLIDITGVIGVVGLFISSRFFGGIGNVLSGATNAAGIIVAVAGASLVDTETFTIEGLAGGPLVDPLPITFEFDSGGGVTVGNVAVPFAPGDTASVVAASMAAAINNPGAPPAGPNTTPGFWRARAFVDAANFPGIVFLRYAFRGALAGTMFAPQFITDTVAATGFIPAGMAGGQDGSLLAPLRWGLSRAAVPVAGFELPGGVG